MKFGKIVSFFLLMNIIIFTGCINENPELSIQPPSSSSHPKPSNQHGGGGGNHGNNNENDDDDEEDIVSPPLNQIIISPSEKNVLLEEKFIIDIVCVPIQPIKAWELSLSYDPDFLQAISMTLGNFFEGFETFTSPTIVINNENGSITQVYCLILGPGTTNKTGTLSSIEFQAIQTGMSHIELYTIGLANETMYVPISSTNSTIYISL